MNPKKFKSPLFCFHGNCDKVCSTDTDFIGLSRSTRCGCSHRSVWQLLRFEQVQNGGRCHGSQGAKNVKFTLIFLQGFIKFDQGISEKSSGEKCVEE
jgi:hypothetical protein